MKKISTLFILFAFYAGGFAQKHVSVVELKDVAASALFESFDPTGCILTDVTMDVGYEVNRTNGTVSKTPLTSVFISVLDLCQGITLLAANGVADSQWFAVADKLLTAHIISKVGMVDSATIEDLAITMDVKWQATSPLLVVKDKVVTHTSPGLTIVSTTTGKFRDATATGTVKITQGTTAYTFNGNLTPIADVAASMSDGTSRTDSITFNKPHKKSGKMDDEEISADNEQPAGDGVSVYPNPTMNNVQLTMSNDDYIGGTAAVYDVNGRLVTQSAIINNQLSIELNAAPGVYFLRVVNGEKVVTRTVVKQ